MDKVKARKVKILNIDDLGFNEYDKLKIGRYCFDLDFDYSENPEKYEGYKLVSFERNIYNIREYLDRSQTFMSDRNGEWDDGMLKDYINLVVIPSIVEIF